MLNINTVEMYRKFFDHYADALNSTRLTEPEQKAFMLAIGFKLQDEFGEQIAPELLPEVSEEDVRLFIAIAKRSKEGMFEEWRLYMNEHADDKDAFVKMWSKALELSDKYGLAFCRDFLPYPDDKMCRKLGKTFKELMDSTINYEEWSETNA